MSAKGKRLCEEAHPKAQKKIFRPHQQGDNINTLSRLCYDALKEILFRCTFRQVEKLKHCGDKLLNGKIEYLQTHSSLTILSESSHLHKNNEIYDCDECRDNGQLLSKFIQRTNTTMARIEFKNRDRIGSRKLMIFLSPCKSLYDYVLHPPTTSLFIYKQLTHFELDKIFVGDFYASKTLYYSDFATIKMNFYKNYQKSSFSHDANEEGIIFVRDFVAQLIGEDSTRQFFEFTGKVFQAEIDLLDAELKSTKPRLEQCCVMINRLDHLIKMCRINTMFPVLKSLTLPPSEYGYGRNLLILPKNLSVLTFTALPRCFAHATKSIEQWSFVKYFYENLDESFNMCGIDAKKISVGFNYRRHGVLEPYDDVYRLDVVAMEALFHAKPWFKSIKYDNDFEIVFEDGVKRHESSPAPIERNNFEKKWPKMRFSHMTVFAREFMNLCLMHYNFWKCDTLDVVLSDYALSNYRKHAKKAPCKTKSCDFCRQIKWIFGYITDEEIVVVWSMDQYRMMKNRYPNEPVANWRNLKSTTKPITFNRRERVEE